MVVVYPIKNYLRMIAALVGLTLLATPAFAQSRGTLRGVVKDELGGLVSGATVTLKAQTGEQKTATANVNGEFAFDGLTVGTYDVSAVAKGFATTELTPVNITANLAASL